MFGIMGIGSAFVNAAGRGGKKKAVNFSFIGTTADPIIKKMSCTGDITVISTKDGEKVTASYSDLSNTAVSIQADANTEITIKGDVTLAIFTEYQGFWSGYTDIVSITTNESLKNLEIAGQTSIVTINTATSSELRVLVCASSTSLTTIDTTFNNELTNLTCSGCSGVTVIKDLAINNSNAVSLNALMKANTSGGTLYTDPDGAEYATLTNGIPANWTIEPLNA